MISKTSCQHCGQHIEFDVENASEFAECPTCAKLTRLYERLKPAAQRHWRISRKAWFVIGWALTICCLAAVFVKVAMTQPEILGVIGGGAFGIVLAILVVVWAVLWLLFPVFVYFSLKEIISLLKQIRDK